MVLQYERILAAFQEITDLEVIDTSDEADEAGHTLPAAVLDFESGSILPFTERGSDFMISPSFSIVLYSQKDTKDRAASRTRLRALFLSVLKKLLEIYPNGFNINNSIIMTAASFGGGDCYAWGFEISLAEEVFSYE